MGYLLDYQTHFESWFRGACGACGDEGRGIKMRINLCCTSPVLAPGPAVGSFTARSSTFLARAQCSALYIHPHTRLNVSHSIFPFPTPFTSLRTRRPIPHIHTSTHTPFSLHPPTNTHPPALHTLHMPHKADTTLRHATHTLSTTRGYEFRTAHIT